MYPPTNRPPMRNVLFDTTSNNAPNFVAPPIPPMSTSFSRQNETGFPAFPQPAPVYQQPQTHATSFNVPQNLNSLQAAQLPPFQTAPVNFQFYNPSAGLSQMASTNDFMDSGPLGSSTLSFSSDIVDEPPLLEELGINFPHILSKTLFVLLPNKQVSNAVVEDTDLAGPLLYLATLGVAMLLTGKLQFGAVYGLGSFGCVFLCGLLNLLHEQGVDLYRTCSVVGYGLVPIVLLAMINVVVDLKGYLGFVLSLLAIFWCSSSASRFFERILDMSEQRWLIAYPLCLFYACFALITVF